MDHYTSFPTAPAPRPLTDLGRPVPERSTLPPPTRVAFLTASGRLALEAEGEISPVPLDSIELGVMGQAVRRREAILRPALDHQGRTVVLVYAPAGEQRAPGVYILSLTLISEAVRQVARRRCGMTRLSARLCAALAETGALPRAARACGITYLTAQSEMSAILQATFASTQSEALYALSEAWLDEPLESQKTVDLLSTNFGLTPRDARIAALIAAGRTRGQAGAMLGLSKWAVKSGCTRIFTSLGVDKAPELTRVTIDLALSSQLSRAFNRNG